MEWDVAIVGTGMGGAALGYALALAGQRVIFLEKGLATSRSSEADDPDVSDPHTRLEGGRWPDRIAGTVNDEEISFYPPLGCGAGGSTLLYAGTLERFAPVDFDKREATGARYWPISYETLAPFYEHAESLFQVAGSPDPFHPGPAPSLAEPPAMSRSDDYFFNLLKRNGLQPYRAHNAGEQSDAADPRPAEPAPAGRHDARSVFIGPALATGNATLLDQCVVEQIDADAERVTRLVCRRDGEEIIVTARHYALAGGALSTPLLLLRSANRVWPAGIANGSGMVGRNLMFHVSDFLAIWPRGRKATAGRAILVRDFYRRGEMSFGVIQSTGLTASARNVAYFLKTAIDAGLWKWLRPLRSFIYIPAFAAAWLFGRATIFATVIEDHPYPGNRVLPRPDEPEAISFDYTIHPELRDRVRLFRDFCRKAFSRHLVMFLTPEVNLNFGHACGTCRMGSDPNTSVVDSEYRSHELSNLYIVDGSVFATSGGINPSLTIAANALRAGAILSARLSQEKGAAMQKHAPKVVEG